jgi:hypothetical protein
VIPHSAANVRERKFGRKFDSIDTDRDGITTLEDWKEFAYYLCSQFGEPTDSPTGVQMREAVLGWWNKILGRLDRYDDRRLTRPEFSAYYGKASEKQLDAVIHNYIDAVFALCDGNADDRLTRREFAGVLRAHGVPEHELTQTMHRMVADDGDISKEKFTDLVLDFCFGTDPRSPGGWLYGTV